MSFFLKMYRKKSFGSKPYKWHFGCYPNAQTQFKFCNFSTPPLKISNCYQPNPATKKYHLRIVHVQAGLLSAFRYQVISLFQWFFNNSAEQKEVENRFITTNGSKSVLTFTPTRTLEYGTLMCRSTNAVGQQKDACIFHIIAAGKNVADSPTYGSDFRLDNATV